ncbi:MAG: prepilin-type N-terminal cleavage/methylation domain-containing protein [Candidatus Omnitrophica bacterium]|nr:prepilin-type N-terminal cleavage/methylation domain-containing protein [Candidatus Omnitrophota bacterium]
MLATIRSRKAFTLIEVIMVIILVGVFSYGVSIYVMRVIDSWKFLTQRYQLEQDGKLALDFIVRDLRVIDIDFLANPDISTAGSSSIVFSNTDSDSIAYTYSGGIIYKNGQPLIKNISSFTIQYYDKSNAEIVPAVEFLSSAQIEQAWYLYARFTAARGDQEAVYSSYVFPRNFLSR